MSKAMSLKAKIRKQFAYAESIEYDEILSVLKMLL